MFFTNFMHAFLYLSTTTYSIKYHTMIDVYTYTYNVMCIYRYTYVLASACDSCGRTQHRRRACGAPDQFGGCAWFDPKLIC